MDVVPGAGGSPADETLAWLYMTDLALFIAHEIDSAYWREWSLFGLPGGVQLFVALHVVGALGALVGLRYLLAGRRLGYAVAFVLALAGIAALFIHGSFLLGGHPEFRLPVSLATIGALFVVSLPLAWLSGRALLTRTPHATHAGSSA